MKESMAPTASGDLEHAGNSAAEEVQQLEAKLAALEAKAVTPALPPPRLSYEQTAAGGAARNFAPPGAARGQSYGAFANLDTKYTPRSGRSGRLNGGVSGRTKEAPPPESSDGVPMRQKVKIALLQLILLTTLIGTSVVAFYHYTHLGEYGRLEQAAMDSRQILATQQNIFRRPPPGAMGSRFGGWMQNDSPGPMAGNATGGHLAWVRNWVGLPRTPNVTNGPTLPAEVLSTAYKWNPAEVESPISAELAVATEPSEDTQYTGSAVLRSPEVSSSQKLSVFKPSTSGHAKRWDSRAALRTITQQNAARWLVETRVDGESNQFARTSGTGGTTRPILGASAMRMKHAHQPPADLAEKVLEIEMENTAHLDTAELNTGQFQAWLDGAASADHIRGAGNSFQN